MVTQIDISTNRQHMAAYGCKMKLITIIRSVNKKRKKWPIKSGWIGDGSSFRKWGSSFSPLSSPAPKWVNWIEFDQLFTFLVLFLTWDTFFISFDIDIGEGKLFLPRLPLSVLLRGNLPFLESDKIVGGSVVEPNSLPFQISLQRCGALSCSQSCGGSVLDANVILNAGIYKAIHF